MVTGPTSGIGRETASALYRQGAHLVLAGRNRQKLETLAQELRALPQGGEIHLLVGDFNSLQDVSKLARDYLAMGLPLHVLINNAGTFTYKRELTRDGFERMFGVNHLAPFLLTKLLLPLLDDGAPSRIINVSSFGYAFVRGMHFDDLMSERGFVGFRAYAHSKLAVMLSTSHLNERLQNSDIAVCSLHPGLVATGIGTQNGWFSKITSAILAPFCKTPQEGAMTSIHAATAQDSREIAGQYLVNRKPRRPRPVALDRDAAALLWQRSEEYIQPFCSGFEPSPALLSPTESLSGK